MYVFLYASALLGGVLGARQETELSSNMKHELTKEELERGRKKASSPESRKKATETLRRNILMKNVVNDAVKELLLENDGRSDEPYYKTFLENFLKAARKSPNSHAGLFIAERLMSETMISDLDSSSEREDARNLDFVRFRLLSGFFKEQRDVILDTNHQKRIIACCSRRAGKTDLAGGAILYASLIPGSRIIYVNLTFTNAINQIWKNVTERGDKAEIAVKSSSKSDGTIEWENGSSLRIIGNPNNSEIEKLRGEAKVSLVVIDEFFHQRNMEYAVNEVISPLLTDRSDSSLLCIGTPPRLAKTYGEKAWNESGWKKYHWTMFDNPYIPNPTEYLDDYCAQKGITKDSPFIQREYFGVIGCYDTEALVFKGRRTHGEDVTENVVSGKVRLTDIAIGVDYGFSDYNSVITVAYDKDGRRSYVVAERKFNRAGVSDVIGAIRKAHADAVEILKRSKVNPDEHLKIYCDTNEESITADLAMKYRLPAFNCFKYDKAYAIEMLSEELRTGRMTIPKGGELDSEMEQILYRRDYDTGAIIPEIDEEEGIHPDAMMALLYASRKVFFDMDYDISFKERPPKTSDFVLDTGGTIVEPDIRGADEGDFENIGTIG